jgi:hypothetical protein
MNPTLLICFILTGIVSASVLIKPLFLTKRESYFERGSGGADFNESLSLLEAISELETDYKLGKLSREDFDELSLEYKRSYLEKK